MTGGGFTISRRVVVVSPGIYLTVIFIATTQTVLVYLLTEKAGVPVQLAITWRASLKEAAIGCIVSSRLNVAACTINAKWPIGGEALTAKDGYTVIHQSITLPACGGITISAPKMKFIY